MRSRLLIASTLLLTLAVVRLPAAPQAGQDSHASVRALQRRVLAALSGNTEIAPGLTLANRFTIENKRAARDYLIATLKELGLDGQRQPYGTDSENIYAELKSGIPGADAIVIGAHYDSVRAAPGANDDGTGVVAVLGVASELMRLKPKTHDVIFVFFDEEERGLVGSRNFAQMLKDTNRAVHSVHTIDQVGWDSNHNRAIELELPFDGAVELYKQAAERMKADIPIYTTTETGSDHNAFRKLGFPAVGITEEYRHQDTTPFIHRAGDTFETVDFDYLASTTWLVVEVMRALTQEVR
jgi:acetylornithine deacetylase/succinyl-diaminopimelate desuccinylase-like protein